MSTRGLAATLARRLPGVLLLGVAVYYAGWGGEYTAFDLHRLQQRKADVADRLAATERQVDSLRTLAERLDSDPATLEAVARERFGMIREGEILYRFVPAAPPPAPADTRVTARTP